MTLRRNCRVVHVVGVGVNVPADIAEALLWVRPNPTTCLADFNRDGTLDTFDYLDFVSAFADGSASADFNHDSVVDFFDDLDFVQAFSAGC